MASTWLAQCSWAVGSSLPRDRMIINPTFSSTAADTAAATTLATDLATNLDAWVVGARELTVKIYDLKADPSYPLATQVRSVGAYTESPHPREVALCLSFYSGHPEPRSRGRLYLPAFAIAAGGSLSARPTSTHMSKLATLPPILAAAGGAGCFWCVYSRRLDQMQTITNWWVDDEWDTIRKRGLRASSRVSGTTSA